jgi:hypothetical protein
MSPLDNPAINQNKPHRQTSITRAWKEGKQSRAI